MHFGVTSGRLPETLLERESPQPDCYACPFPDAPKTDLARFVSV